MDALPLTSFPAALAVVRCFSAHPVPVLGVNQSQPPGDTSTLSLTVQSTLEQVTKQDFEIKNDLVCIDSGKLDYLCVLYINYECFL